VLIHAVGSGLGTAASQIAKQLGATVIGTSRSSDKLARALVYGLDVGIDTSRTPFPEAIGEPVDVVFDVLGGPALADNLAVLAPRGRLILLGFLAGSQTTADLGPLLRKRLEIVGTVMRTRGLEERIPLVREFGNRMLPLFEPLHQDGLVVIAMGLRGCTSSTLQVSGQTFGLHEALDVKAACQLLRDQPFVDGSRIAVVGVGSGATAAVLAAKNDPQIRATVLIDPPGTADEVLRLHVGPNKPLLQWMQPLCKWTFQLGYRVDAAEMEIDRFPEVTKFRPSLTLQSAGEAKFLSKPSTIEVIRTFLCDNDMMLRFSLRRSACSARHELNAALAL